MKRYKNTLLSLVAGLIVGTLPAIWPLRIQAYTLHYNGVDFMRELTLGERVLAMPGSLKLWVPLCTALGFILVIGAESLSTKKSDKNTRLPKKNLSEEEAL